MLLQLVLLTICLKTINEGHYFKFTFLLQMAVLSSPFGQKALLPGRIITLETCGNQKVLAVVLQVESGSSGQNFKDKTLTVLSILEADPTGNVRHQTFLLRGLPG
jgi:hypothetical protein